MIPRSITLATEGDDTQFSFYEAETPLFKQEFDLSASPCFRTTNKPIPPDKNNVSQETFPQQEEVQSSKSPFKANCTKPLSNAEAFPTAQTLCFERCHKTTALIDRISIHIIECLTSTKQLPHGFDTLSHDFLDTYHIILSIEVSLVECNRTAREFPVKMFTELSYKLRVAQANFQMLDQMLDKLHGLSGLKRGWGKLFGDTDIRKMINALSETRESLRMSSLVFQWSFGRENAIIEMGVGCTALSAALDRLDQPSSRGRTMTLGSTRSHPRQNAFHRQQQQRSVPPRSWAWISSSIPRGNSRPTDSREGRKLSLGPDLRLGHDCLRSASPRTDLYNKPNIVDEVLPITRVAETDSSFDDSSPDDSSLDNSMASDYSHSNVVRHQVDPSAMPRYHPRQAPISEAEYANMNTALLSAIRSKNHDVVEQLLDRGASVNTMINAGALNEAIFNHDQETLELLLLFGADPNAPDCDGNTSLRMAVAESFISGATILLKYGADPDLSTRPDLEYEIFSTTLPL
jgi:hypothetical protein